MILIAPTVDEVDGRSANAYADDIALDGFVSSHTRVMAMNPEADAAFEALLSAIVPALGVRLYELVTLAAAGALRSRHCLLQHGRKTLRAGVLDEDQLARVIVDYSTAGLSDAEEVAMAYAEKLCTRSAEMTDADSQALRDAGYSDLEIVAITMAAAARNFLSRTLQALAVPVEGVPELGPALSAKLLDRADRP